jgi:hypothetical protein
VSLETALKNPDTFNLLVVLLFAAESAVFFDLDSETKAEVLKIL